MTSDIRQDVAFALLINPLPASIRVRLLLDEAFRSKLGIKPQFWYPLKNGLFVEAGSLHDALRAAIAGRKTASITLKNGRRARVKLAAAGGKATLRPEKEGFAFTHADLLSTERQCD